MEIKYNKSEGRFKFILKGGGFEGTQIKMIVKPLDGTIWEKKNKRWSVDECHWEKVIYIFNNWNIGLSEEAGYRLVRLRKESINSNKKIKV